MLSFPFRRRRREPAEGGEVAAPAQPSAPPGPAPAPAWAGLPPIARATATPAGSSPAVTGAGAFASGLTSRHAPTILRAPEHQLGGDAPIGVVDGLATAVERTPSTPAVSAPVDLPLGPAGDHAHGDGGAHPLPAAGGHQLVARSASLPTPAVPRALPADPSPAPAPLDYSGYDLAGLDPDAARAAGGGRSASSPSGEPAASAPVSSAPESASAPAATSTPVLRRALDEGRHSDAAIADAPGSGPGTAASTGRRILGLGQPIVAGPAGAAGLPAARGVHRKGIVIEQPAAPTSSPARPSWPETPTPATPDRAERPDGPADSAAADETASTTSAIGEATTTVTPDHGHDPSAPAATDPLSDSGPASGAAAPATTASPTPVLRAADPAASEPPAPERPAADPAASGQQPSSPSAPGGATAGADAVTARQPSHLPAARPIATVLRQAAADAASEPGVSSPVTDPGPAKAAGAAPALVARDASPAGSVEDDDGPDPSGPATAGTGGAGTFPGLGEAPGAPAADPVGAPGGTSATAGTVPVTVARAVLPSLVERATTAPLTALRAAAPGSHAEQALAATSSEPQPSRARDGLAGGTPTAGGPDGAPAVHGEPPTQPAGYTGTAPGAPTSPPLARSVTDRLLSVPSTPVLRSFAPAAPGPSTDGGAATGIVATPAAPATGLATLPPPAPTGLPAARPNGVVARAAAQAAASPTPSGAVAGLAGGLAAGFPDAGEAAVAAGIGRREPDGSVSFQPPTGGPVMRAEESVPATVAPSEPVAATGESTGEPAAPAAGGRDLAKLADDLYERIERRFRAEVLFDRERKALLADTARPGA